MKKPRSAKRVKKGDGAALDVRGRIVVATIDCFAEKGVEETTQRDIALRADLAPSLFKYYYPTMKPLIFDVVQYLLKDLMEFSTRSISTTEKDPLKNLESYALATIRWPRERPKYFAIWMYFYHKSTHDPELAEVNAKIREGGRNRISLMVYQARESQQIQEQAASVAELALAIQSLLTGFAIVWATEKGLDFKMCQSTLILSLHNLLKVN